MIVNIAASMEEEIVDINAEYERIFGSTPKPLLFDEDEYALLRKEIEESDYLGSEIIYERIQEHKTRYSDLQSPRTDIHQKLPFEGFALTPYASILLERNIKIYQNSHNLFYIEKREGNSIIARAAAYYTRNMQCLFVLEGSFFKENSYSKELLNKEFLKKSEFFNLDGCYFYQNTKLSYEFPSAVASLFLGESATLQAWANREGKTLDEVYPCFRNLEKILEKKDDEENQKNNLTNLIGGIINNATFKLSQIISAVESRIRSDSSHTTLRDKNNRYLTNHHPKEQTTKAIQFETKNIEYEWENHIFLIKVGSNNGAPLYASGIFNPIDKSFTLKSGSWLSVYETLMFQYGIYGKSRKTIIAEKCSSFKYGYLLNENHRCLNCSIASFIVLAYDGVDGKTVWKDANGVDLGTWARTNGFEL